MILHDIRLYQTRLIFGVEQEVGHGLHPPKLPVVDLFFDGLTPDFQIVIPSFGIIEGPFQVAAIEYGGSLNGEATYELSLQSAGQLSFTADTADAPEGGV